VAAPIALLVGFPAEVIYDATAAVGSATDGGKEVGEVFQACPKRSTVGHVNDRVGELAEYSAEAGLGIHSVSESGTAVHFFECACVTERQLAFDGLERGRFVDLASGEFAEPRDANAEKAGFPPLLRAHRHGSLRDLRCFNNYRLPDGKILSFDDVIPTILDRAG
jgi:hypothetical protein